MGDNFMYCNQVHIITYIPSPLLYSIKSHSQVLLTLKVREFHKNMNTRRQESWGPPLKLSITIDTVKFLGIRVLGFFKQFLLECVFLSGDKNSDSQKYPWNLGVMNKHLLILPIDISECKRLAKFEGTPPSDPSWLRERNQKQFLVVQWQGTRHQPRRKSFRACQAVT